MKIKLSIVLLIAVLGGSAGILALTSHTVLFFVAWSSAKEANQQSARIAAENTALNVANVVKLLSQSLSAQANDPKLASTLAKEDPVFIQPEEERVTKSIPSAWLVRLLPESIDVPDEHRTPKMGFADLNMARSAAIESIQPSINLVNTTDAHLAIAHRLANGGGVLLASWPLKVLESAISDQGSCAVELRQDTARVTYRGDASCKDLNPDGEVMVENTGWKIVYWYKQDFFPDYVWYLSALGISLTLLAALTYLLIRIFTASNNQDRKSITAIVGELLGGDRQGDTSFKLTESFHLAAELFKLRRITREMVPSHHQPEGLGHNFDIVQAHQPDEFDGYQAILESRQTTGAPTAAAPILPKIEIPACLFHANHLRGITGESLTAELIYAIGLGIGSEVINAGERRIVLGKDNRPSSRMLIDPLINGLVETGCSVIDLGTVPTPLMYFACHALEISSGVMLTGGHNPLEYNGLKILIGGEVLAQQKLKALRQRIELQQFVRGSGRVDQYKIQHEYIERILNDTQMGRPLHIVVDCGNGAASLIVPELLRQMGCDVVEMNCDPDSLTPEHQLNPGKPKDLDHLITMVTQMKADIGIAFDSDGDAFGLVDNKGKIIWPDRLMMLFAADVLSREPGADILFDVKCSRHLPTYIVKNGGRPIMWKVGNGAMQNKLQESGAVLAGEFSGHFYFKERWHGYDDGIYASCRIIEILSTHGVESSEIFRELPEGVSSPELLIPMEPGESFQLLEILKTTADFSDARISEVDGLRVDFLDGWGLIRASDSLPALSFRFEADSEKSLAHIQSQFKQLLEEHLPDLKLPF